MYGIRLVGELYKFHGTGDGSRPLLRRSFAEWAVYAMTQKDAEVNPVIGGNILLLDDNAIQAATRQSILKRAGYGVTAALSPLRALEQFRGGGFPGEISAVITDHMMPGMNGAEFVRELRKIHPEMPVIVISGLEEAQDEYEGLNVRFLLKPLPPDQLLANIHDLLDHYCEGAA
jgi:CheY-like chemotaxis protein